MNKELQKVMKKLDSVSKYIPSTEILSVIKDLAVAYKEDHAVKSLINLRASGLLFYFKGCEP